MNSGSSASQPMGLPAVSVAVPPSYPPAPPPTVTGGGLTKAVYVGDEPDKQEWEPEFRETFSKGMLKMKLREYWGGKITQRYVETYLEFMHLSGHIDNLEFLEFKNALTRGQL